MSTKKSPPSVEGSPARRSLVPPDSRNTAGDSGATSADKPTHERVQQGPEDPAASGKEKDRIDQQRMDTYPGSTPADEQDIPAPGRNAEKLQRTPRVKK